MTGGHHGSVAGRFFQVAGFGGVGAAGAGLGVPPLGGWDAAPPEGGTPCDTLAVERPPSPSEGEGWGEGEDVGVLGEAAALEAGGFSPSPRPASAGRGRALDAGWAEAAFTLSAGAETTAFAGTVTEMVGACSLRSSRGMSVVPAVSAKAAGSFAGRSGAEEAEAEVLAAAAGVFLSGSGDFAGTSDGLADAAGGSVGLAGGLAGVTVDCRAVSGSR